MSGRGIVEDPGSCPASHYKLAGWPDKKLRLPACCLENHLSTRTQDKLQEESKMSSGEHHESSKMTPLVYNTCLRHQRARTNQQARQESLPALQAKCKKKGPSPKLPISRSRDLSFPCDFCCTLEGRYLTPQLHPSSQKTIVKMCEFLFVFVVFTLLELSVSHLILYSCWLFTTASG